MEVRLAAHYTKDTGTLAKAESNEASEVYDGNVLIAKWVTISEKRAAEVPATADLVRRKNDSGQVELLVLIGPDDITYEDVRAMSRGMDREGRLALDVELDGVGEAKLQNLTKNNYGRYLAQIINGRVMAVPRILSVLRNGLQIPGDFTDVMLNEIAQTSGKRFYERHRPSPYAVTITPLRVVLLLGVLLTIIVACFPAHGLNESKHPRCWIAASVVVCALLGAWQLAVRTSAVPVEMQRGPGIITEHAHISILHGVLGLLVGGALGIPIGYVIRFLARRAIHNSLTACKLVITSLLPAQVRGVFGRLAGAGESSRLNRGQAIALWTGLLLVVALILFPPWMGSRMRIVSDDFPEGYAPHGYEFIGFHFLFSGRASFWGYLIFRIDYEMLAMLCVGVLLLMGLAVYLLRSKSENAKKEDARNAEAG
jgi:hypothetical protein